MRTVLSGLLQWMIVLACVTGCAEQPAANPEWVCPSTWVRYTAGGCGPAVLLCAPGGGAAPGACDGLDLHRGVPAGDGGVTFHLREDGSIGGGWHEPGDPGGPPPADWSPTGVPAPDWRPAAGVSRCPEGWRRADGACDPLLRSDCPAGSGPLPGGTCTPTAESDCPNSRFPEVPAEAVGRRIVYVDSAAGAGGTGTREAPLASLDRAVSEAGEDGWVLLAGGTYPANLVVTGRRHIVGVCAARSRIVGAAASAVVVARGAAASAQLVGLSLEGGLHGAGSEGGGLLRAVRVRVQGAVRRGLYAEGAMSRTEVTDGFVTRCGINGLPALAGGSLTALRVSSIANINLGAGADGAGSQLSLTDVAIVGTTSLPDGVGGGGITVQNGSAVRAERLALDRNRYIAMSASSGSAATITDAFIRDTDTDGNGGFGQSIRADMASTIVGTRVTALRARVSGVAATGTGSSIRLTECVVRDTVGTTVEGRQREGFGAVAAMEALVVLGQCAVERNLNTGVQAESAGRVELRDSVVADTIVPAGATFSVGVNVRTGGTGLLERTRISGQRGLGVGVSGARSVVTASDTLVRDNEEQPGGGGGIGVSAEAGGRVELVRSRLSNNVTVGVQVVEAGSDATLQDVIIEGTRQQTDGEKGAGLSVDGSAIGRATRTLLATNHQAGVIAQNAARVELTEVVVRDTQPIATFEASGTGVLSMQGSHIEARRVLVLRNHASGLHAQDGATLRFADGAVEESRSVTREQSGGWGASVISTGRIELVRSRLDRNVNAGVFAADSGRVLLEDVAIRETQPSTVPFQRFGRGIEVNTGGQLTARRLLLWGNSDVGVTTMLAGHTRLEDAIVAAVRPVAFGFGIGVSALGAVTTQLQRVAIVDVGGAALAANRSLLMVADPSAGGGVVTAEHLFIRRVQPQQIRQVMPVGPRVAYGVEVGARSRVEIASGVVAEAGWGFHQADGELTWRRGVITGQTQAAGVVSRAMLRDRPFVDVRVLGNSSDEVAVDETLPELALPPPQMPCATPPCTR